MSLEHRFGVPTVQMHTNLFERQVRSTVRFNGMQGMRCAFVPQPVMGKSDAELRAYVDGTDPISGRPVMQEVIEGLTRPLGEHEVQKAVYRRATPRLVERDTEDNLHQLFLENHWTDMFPIVLPTEERVQKMLTCTSHKPDEVVGRMAPAAQRRPWEYTVEKVAVNAVMAGARPEYFPVILALASSGQNARATSTSSMASMVVVNGPVRHEICMNSGIGALGPYNHANATIGRAYSLLSQNLPGGSIPGLTYQGSMGNGYSFSGLCFAENEERSPWEPFHVEKGFSPTDSTVSIFSNVWHTGFTLGVREQHWRDHVRHMLLGMDPLNRPLFALDPIAARLFVERGGFASKAALREWAYETALIRASEYWDYQLMQNYVLPRATSGEEPYASRLAAAPNELVNMFNREAINIVVVGGETNGYWRLFGAGYIKTISVDAWR
jgi:hypothetical protein